MGIKRMYINCAPAIGSMALFTYSDDNKLYAIATSSKGPADSHTFSCQNARHTGRATYSIEKAIRSRINKPENSLLKIT